MAEQSMERYARALAAQVEWLVDRLADTGAPIGRDTTPRWWPRECGHSQPHPPIEGEICGRCESDAIDLEYWRVDVAVARARQQARQ